MKHKPGKSKRIARHLLVAGIIGLAVTHPVQADPVADFYSGKTIDMIIGYSAGGGYDQYARLVSRHLSKHIPGNPDIVPRNMPGASSRLAAEYVYNVAPRDGTILATADQSLAVAQAMGDDSLTLDASEFGYIGSPVMQNNVLITWHTSEVKTVADAQAISVPIGATGGSTSSQYPTLMNELIGTQFNIITGYPGGNDINLAMETGEVDGRGSVNWASVVPLGWQEQGLMNVLVQIGLQREPDLPDVPLLYELAQNEDDARLLRLISAPTTVGRPVFTTPDVPQERLDALRAAFDAMLEDPEFQAAAAREGLGLSPVSGAELQQIVDEIISTPEPIAARLGELIGVAD
ncbi:Bug family tripartite tricarboxylate transporter substrate binding protein [Roseicitreum antarcticum]|uniref:Tripartite-type tricarboxylate transporter, receptor component TctC n=1 Tax=Roseicitreum antarcticum TaxID=564137 RepID=A0A1H2W1K6_9RHOB|nr:tripartite tricarboxylate transporter substrate-binding protein [Roseicitreum antarcticum]SDW74411.1 Tripartite-type tricarboxylate transporter, receptor component TctC [Roseicitreum antarcticum]